MGKKKQRKLDYQDGLEDGWIDRTIKEYKDSDREAAIWVASRRAEGQPERMIAETILAAQAGAPRDGTPRADHAAQAPRHAEPDSGDVTFADDPAPLSTVLNGDTQLWRLP